MSAMMLQLSEILLARDSCTPQSHPVVEEFNSTKMIGQREMVNNIVCEIVHEGHGLFG